MLSLLVTKSIRSLIKELGFYRGSKYMTQTKAAPETRSGARRNREEIEIPAYCEKKDGRRERAFEEPFVINRHERPQLFSAVESLVKQGYEVEVTLNPRNPFAKEEFMLRKPFSPEKRRVLGGRYTPELEMAGYLGVVRDENTKAEKVEVFKMKLEKDLLALALPRRLR